MFAWGLIYKGETSVELFMRTRPLCWDTKKNISNYCTYKKRSRWEIRVTLLIYICTFWNLQNIGRMRGGTFKVGVRMGKWFINRHIFTPREWMVPAEVVHILTTKKWNNNGATLKWWRQDRGNQNGHARMHNWDEKKCAHGKGSGRMYPFYEFLKNKAPIKPHNTAFSVKPINASKGFFSPLEQRRISAVNIHVCIFKLYSEVLHLSHFVAMLVSFSFFPFTLSLFTPALLFRFSMFSLSRSA